MRQFFLPEDYDGSPDLTLKGEDHHYITRVLRFSPGDSFPGRDRSGGLYTLEIIESGPEKSLISVRPAEKDQEDNEEVLPEIVLYTCVLKGKKFDQVIRQATETGVDRIQPLISRNTVVRLSPGEDGKKRERWQKIALEASQQCGNTVITRISPPADLKEFPLPKQGLSLFFHEKTLENKSLHMYLRKIPGSVHLFFGPEGGFSPEETERFLKSGFLPVYLGPNVLRAETAVIYGTGAVQTILRERKNWQGNRKV